MRKRILSMILALLFLLTSGIPAVFTYACVMPSSADWPAFSPKITPNSTTTPQTLQGSISTPTSSEPAPYVLASFEPTPSVPASSNPTPFVPTPTTAAMPTSPTPTDVPKATPIAPTPSATPTPETFIPETLKKMAQYDYIANSVTGLSSVKQSREQLEEAVAAFGKLYFSGMPYSNYKKAMGYEWTDCTDYSGKPVKLSLDLSKTLNYEAYVKLLKKLSRYEGVYLYKIGESQQGRAIYAIEVDFA